MKLLFRKVKKLQEPIRQEIPWCWRTAFLTRRCKTWQCCCTYKFLDLQCINLYSWPPAAMEFFCSHHSVLIYVRFTSDPINGEALPLQWKYAKRSQEIVTCPGLFFFLWKLIIVNNKCKLTSWLWSEAIMRHLAPWVTLYVAISFK